MNEMLAASVLALVVPLLFCVRCVARERAPFTLTVMHTNDVHAHIEESTKYGAMCSVKDKRNKTCVGGVARIKTKVSQLKKQYPGALFMNAGDFFQGTAWYTVLKEKIISAVMTRMDYDYACLGNHEFDDGPEGLEHHLVALQNANVTIVGTNTDFSEEPALRNITLPKSVTTEVNGVRVGIVGAVLPETRFLSNTGKVKFEDEVQSIKREAEKLEEDGVNVIVAITHSGYPRDIDIVRQVEQLDLLVGGHTNTFLYHGKGYPKENTPEGDYPTVVNRSDGSRGLVVQDYWFGKFLGFLRVSFDNNGKVTNWTGNPVLLNSSVEEDKEMLDVINCYKENVTRAISEVIGTSKVKLEQAEQVCRLRECNLGNLIADGFFAYYADKESSEPDLWSDVNGALFNGGAVRAPIPQNRIRVTYNLRNPPKCRVVSLQVLCRRCKVPRYEVVNDTGVYRIVTTDYITRGGDGYPKATNATSGGPADYSVLVDHIRKMTPVKSAIEGRITLLNGSQPVMIPGDPVTNPLYREKEEPAERLLSSHLRKLKHALNIVLRNWRFNQKKVSELLGK